MPEYKAVKLGYRSDSESATSGLLGGKRGVDLREVNELTEKGWSVHTFSFGEDGCWQEAILVRNGDGA